MNIIDQAADRLRGRWVKGRLGDVRGDGPVCLAGALKAVLDDPLATLPLSVLGPIGDILWDERADVSVAKFNDDPATTEEDVLLLLKRASALYDERTGQTS